MASAVLYACSGPNNANTANNDVLEVTPAPTPTPEPTPVPTLEPLLQEVEEIINEPHPSIGKQGHINIPNTKVDYPLMLAEDNEYYLDKDSEGKRNYRGSIFYDYRNADPNKRRNIILYGHNNKDGTMFQTLHRYEDRSFFVDNPKIDLESFGRNYEYEIIYVGNLDDREYVHFETEFQNDQQYVDFLREGVKRAKYVRKGYIPSADDEIITLSTCVSPSMAGADYIRWVVVAKKVGQDNQNTGSTVNMSQGANNVTVFDSGGAQVTPEPTQESDNSSDNSSSRREEPRRSSSSRNDSSSSSRNPSSSSSSNNSNNNSNGTNDTNDDDVTYIDEEIDIPFEDDFSGNSIEEEDIPFDDDFSYEPDIPDEGLDDVEEIMG